MALLTVSQYIAILWIVNPVFNVPVGPGFWPRRRAWVRTNRTWTPVCRPICRRRLRGTTTRCTWGVRVTGLGVKRSSDPFWASTTAPCHHGASTRWHDVLTCREVNKFSETCSLRSFIWYLVKEELFIPEHIFKSPLTGRPGLILNKAKITSVFVQAPINFSNSEFYGFSELFYCTEDVLRLGGQYDSLKYSKAAAVPRHTSLSHSEK